ncbi:DNA cytosine methyltransferase [Aliihoeflea sp. 40Bstr573]|uniref:DNA cytosine methyltransferase n=1 Tax=Aliihoeflea sp. 40Bstr573 TaxID=2696467 RepID=UPI0020960C12|nr:DNA (cytosine-5-)-methyltransferase [Aliihoeflea sp. 40Bstr573]MCO6387478.1 DNA (cytosine-5-)-methyltransferase [Aliihoeflea sp. 40Bstr573]
MPIEDGDATAPEKGLGHRLQEISKVVANDRRRALRSLFQVAQRCEAIRQEVSAREYKVFMTDICGITKSDVASYLALMETLGEHQELLIANAVSPALALKLVRARPDVRDEALRMIRSGRNVQPSELPALKRDIDHVKLLVEDSVDLKRPALLRQAAARKGRRLADGLLNDFEQFASQLLIWIEKPAFNPFIGPEAGELAELGRNAAALAARVRQVVDQSDLAVAKGGFVWSDALHALDQIAAGEVSEEPWDRAEEEMFEVEARREIIFNIRLLEDVAGAFGHRFEAGGPRQRRIMNDMGRIVLSDDRQHAQLQQLTVLEICAGGGGQAIGLHAAGFHHVGLIERLEPACATLKLNRPDWPIIKADVADIDFEQYRGVDLLAGGVPCQPFSFAGEGLGKDDPRDLFRRAVEITGIVQPKAIMFENVMGLLGPKHLDYRLFILSELDRLGYEAEWRAIEAPSFGMAQKRERAILVGFKKGLMHRFRWPEPLEIAPKTIGETLLDLMASNGWPHAEDWAAKATGHCMTIIGGSERKTSFDLAMEKGREHWFAQGINPSRRADNAPDASAGPVGELGSKDQIDTYPKLTIRMVARLQGFPDEWRFAPHAKWTPETGYDLRGDIPLGSPMPKLRQIANAFPPPLARVLGIRIKRALTGYGESIPDAVDQPFRSTLGPMARLNLSDQSWTARMEQEDQEYDHFFHKRYG